ncbi:MAG: NAD(P)/FAD-dependent oxidoreductase [Rubrivivax sp.]
MSAVIPADAVRDAYDVAVIGAGPAGLSAATHCARAGLSTVLFDEQGDPGGQIYRGIMRVPASRRTLLGEDYAQGAALAEAFKASGAQYLAGASVWSVSKEREIGVSIGGAARLTQARRIVIATGALERPMPIPGWTLPGVMTVGAAQILLKTSGLVPSGRVVLAGCGPLLYLFAWQLLRAGRAPAAILDTTDPAARSKAMGHLAAFVFSRYFVKGASLMWAVRRQVRIVRGVTALAVKGDGRASTIEFEHAGGRDSLAVDTVLLHQGVVPNVNLAHSIGIEHRWDEVQLAFVPVLDEDGTSAVDGIAIAGDGAGIAGAWAAEDRGTLAAIAAARALQAPKPAALPDENTVRQRLHQNLAARRFVDLMYRPAARFRQPTGDTLVCRCEEITAQQIRGTVALGCTGPNQMKAFLRCGMGPCQGRYCGLTVTELMAAERGVSPQEVGYYRLRPPIKPVTVAELAALPQTEASVKAVVRG